MSQAQALRCRCRGIPFQALTVPLVNVPGILVAGKYLLEPFCRQVVPVVLKMLADASDGETWATEEDEEIEVITGDGVRPFTTVTTVNSLNPGGVVTEARYTDEDGLLVKYVNETPFEPHRGVTMTRVDHDTTMTALHTKPYVCLRPALGGVVDDCGRCNDGRTYSMAMVVSIPELTAGPTTNDCICNIYGGTWIASEFGGVRFADGCGAETDHREGPCDPAGITGTYGTVYFFPKPGDPTKSILQFSPSGGLPLTIDEIEIARTSCDIALNGGTFEIPLTSLDCVGDLTATIDIIPITVDGEVRNRTNSRCLTADPFAPCDGTAVHTLRQTTYGSIWSHFEWETVSGCEGSCDGTTCVAPKPFAVPKGLILTSVAEANGWLAYVDVETETECDCTAVDDECNGDSGWGLVRKCQIGLEWLWAWLLGSSDCTGTCDPACLPDPPFPLPNGGVMSTVASDALDLPALSGYESIPGGCVCTDDPYVEPECPVCVVCDDRLTSLTFILSGLTGGSSFYNGTYFLVKSATDSCDGMECCWYGASDGVFPQHAIVSWSGTQWRLEFEPGQAVYLLTSSDPCLSPITLSLDSAPAGEGWPSTKTALDA